MNLDQVLADKFDMSFSTFYGRNKTNEPSAGGDGGPFFALAFLEPHVDPLACCNPDGSPYRNFIQDKRSNASNPLYDLYNVDRNRQRDRFTGGVKARWRPLSWLAVDGNMNFDQISEQYTEAGPVTYWSASNKTSGTPGNYSRSAANNRNLNTGVSLTGNWMYHGSGSLLESVGITARGSGSYEDVETNFLSATASQYIVKEVPEFPGTKPEGQRAFSQDTEERTKELFGVGTVDLSGKIILDGLLRRDASSLFGPDARNRTYYRVSGALRLPQLLGWHGLQELRLRASYGTAGLRPNFFASTRCSGRRAEPSSRTSWGTGCSVRLTPVSSRPGSTPSSGTAGSPSSTTTPIRRPGTRSCRRRCWPPPGSRRSGGTSARSSPSPTSWRWELR